MQDESPQLENGYTRLANELLDALIGAGLTARQWAVVMAVIRKTYGFNKTSDEIGLSQLVAMTGLDKGNLSKTVRELESAKVLNRSAGVHGYSLGINKKHKQWGLLNQQPQLSKRQPLSNQQQNGCHNDNEGVVESTTSGLSKRQPQNTSLKTTQKTTPKDNLSRSLRERFEVFWEAHPKKKSKTAAEKAFAKRKPDEQLFADIMSGLERAKTSVEWLDKQFVPYPASWLNDGGWMDDYTPATYTDAQLAVMAAFNDALGDNLGEASSEVFDRARAAAIDDFLGFRTSDPTFWQRYFPWVAEKVDVPPRCGFDYLISREGFSKISGGQHTRKEQ
ncbi:replication protein [Burkholderia pseudomallei]|uniref:replication protein n=1 Tax=Burkholderia pseudomallei TaxID=28450 RepID=UPI000977FCC0|nr:replication protein [Burkholderia pseudomallei]CAJ2717526.1 phage replication protein O, N-terminal domain [Burkholderia pseudomallei]CAJ4669187.1 phage replication protein O, N-terminal domain [Burkholderia pseudomallei]VBM94921.1 phage replication protein O, N-terminal domain [Burkholderia pseudomallei]VBX79491.1 phage replication protein O, N-terminal domain [Burkholderia pseudomallei]VBX79518.1 phage replication protein O, N-terminal domain [Burkholderia pseudomallei]